MSQLARNLRTKTTALIMIALLFAPFSAVMAQGQGGNNTGVQIPILGTVAGGGAFEGLFNLQRFVVQDGQLLAVGTLTGTLTNAAGDVVGSIVRTISFVVDTATTQASCEILHLELGPLDLNLLGLMVNLNRIVLDISAQPGPGNLLGNLLCAVANLLNQGGPLQGLANLLNNILRGL